MPPAKLPVRYSVMGERADGQFRYRRDLHHFLGTRPRDPAEGATAMASTRILHSGLAKHVMLVEEAAALIRDGMTIGRSGFTGSGYPKAVPLALATCTEAGRAAG